MFISIQGLSAHQLSGLLDIEPTDYNKTEHGDPVPTHWTLTCTLETVAICDPSTHQFYNRWLNLHAIMADNIIPALYKYSFSFSIVFFFFKYDF